MIWLRLAYKELSNNLRFTLLFIFNMSLGLIGFITLGSSSQSLQDYIENNLKTYLAGDIAIQSDIALSEHDNQIIKNNLISGYSASDQIQFMSMVVSSTGSKLVQIFGIDTHFPLYGDFILKGNQKVESKVIQDQLELKHHVWMHSETRTALSLKKGEIIKIGKHSFIVGKDIQKDPGGLLSSNSFAPRIYLGINRIKDTGLIATGSRILHIKTIAFKTKQDTVEKSKRLQIALSNNWKSTHPKPRVRSLSRTNDRVVRLLDYLTGYLGLISIIALFLAGVGTGYLFRSFVLSRMKEVAVLSSLGATKKESYLILIYQVFILGILSAIFSTIGAAGLIQFTPQLLNDVIPSDFTAQMDINSILLAFVMGTLGSLLFCLPVLANLSQMSPAELFQDENSRLNTSNGNRLIQFSSYLPLVFIFWILSVYYTGMYRGSLFLLLFTVTLFFLGLGAGTMIFITGRILFNNLIVNLAFRNLSRHKISGISCFLAIGMGAFLMNLIPQIQQGIKSEISKPEGLILPNFFLIGIQTEQVKPLIHFLKEKDISLQNLSPMVRARLDKVGRIGSIELDDEQIKSEQRLRKRGFSITYRNSLTKAESLVSGKPLASKYDFSENQPAEISIEKRFAERNALKLGDKLTFEVSGIPLDSVIVNIRSVRWNSFQPSYFVVMQPGVLEDAPQTFLATLPAVTHINNSTLQRQLVEEFPNITMIDVSKAITEILAIADKIGWALKAMAWLSITAGLVVVFSIAKSEAEQRKWELNLLKVLGGTSQDIQLMVQIEFGFLGLLAATSGVALSIAMSLLISSLFFNGLWVISWFWILASVAVITLISMGTSVIATRSIIRQKPWKILKTV